MAVAKVLDRVPTSLVDLGLDEAWLEQWIRDSPRRLGLGNNIRVVRSQLHRPSGTGAGRLDLQVIDNDLEDRVYDVELMRGALDADHGFRALAYWANEQRADDQEREHWPVIVAEQVRSSRYWVLLETLASRIKLIALEVRSALVEDKPVVWVEPVLLPEELLPDNEGGVAPAPSSLTKDAWLGRTTDEFQRFFEKLTTRLDDWGLAYSTVWSAKSYIGLWKNARCWCPIWPRKDGAGRIYLPTPEGWGDGSDAGPPPEFATAAAGFEKIGAELVWTWRYNMGSNPIGVTLEEKHLDAPAVRTLLEGSWKGLP